MEKKLFVGGLSWGTKEDDLQVAFAKFGEITHVKIITDRETGRSRGFGFVSFANGDDALTAVSQMDGTELDGRSIKVSEAEDKRDARPRSGGGGSGGGNFNRNRY